MGREAEEQGSREQGAGSREQGSRGTGEQGSRGAGGQGSVGQVLDIEPLRAMYEILMDTPYTELRDVLAEYIKLVISNQVPARTQLLQNYPNPFNPEVWIPFRLAEEAEVTIAIYNLAGQLVKTINPGKLSAGSYLNQDRAVYWDSRDEKGKEVSSGVYFYQLKAGSFTDTRKMIHHLRNLPSLTLNSVNPKP